MLLARLSSLSLCLMVWIGPANGSDLAFQVQEVEDAPSSTVSAHPSVREKLKSLAPKGKPSRHKRPSGPNLTRKKNTRKFANLIVLMGSQGLDASQQEERELDNPNPSASRVLSLSQKVTGGAHVIEAEGVEKVPQRPSFLLRHLQRIGDEPEQRLFLVVVTSLAPFAAILNIHALSSYFGDLQRQFAATNVACVLVVMVLGYRTYRELERVTKGTSKKN